MAAFDVNAILAGHNAQAVNILSGYGLLGDQVLGGLAGSNQAQLMDINDRYYKADAANTQDLISRGLRSTTRKRTDSSSLLGQKWRADIASNNALAQLAAGYGSQIGLAGLGAAGNFMNSGDSLGLGYGNLNYQYDALAARNAAAAGQSAGQTGFGYSGYSGGASSY